MSVVGGKAVLSVRVVEVCFDVNINLFLYLSKYFSFIINKYQPTCV